MQVLAAQFLAFGWSELSENTRKYVTYAGIAVACLIGLAILVRIFQWLTRGFAFSKLAKDLGLERSRKDTWQLTTKCAFLPLFSKSSGGRVAGGIVHGAREGVQVKIFDYSARKTSGIFRFRRRTTVVLLEMNYNFPFFYMRRERFSDKLAAVVGHNDIDDFTNKDFAKKFYVKSADRQFAHDLMPETMVAFVMAMVGDEPINIEMSRSLMAFHLDKCVNTKKAKWLYNFGWEFYQKTPEEAVARSR